ncbi:NAD(P)-dependent oxidoreductase [Jiella pacifica]|uniref:NAD-binding protein n=1 Tax=Jiella pacifica TaxID=2696469 RepID=A0A6N9SVT9_9HYPH|nr:NAD(P)-dependent oxidoreductase [Jiella pacifica]NDW03163.1 NAD-binding protein [Jiella pacifica]
MTNQTVGLVGIGMMGWHMAANLVKAGRDVVIYDADQARVQSFTAEIGGQAAGDLASLAGKAATVITMLPNSKIVTDVVLGENGLAAGMGEGSTLIEMSSGVPADTIALGAQLAEQGIAIIDAPVSGGVPRAKTGELTIMAGGDEAVVEACRPVLEIMGSSVVHVGILGAGQAMKALNNLVSAGGFLIGIEALLVGQKFGLDPDRMVDILNSSSGMNNSTQRKFKQYVLSRQFSNGGFGIGLMAKDVGIALDVAKSVGVPVPFSAHCAQVWAAASIMLGAGEDHTAITRICEQFAGMTLGSAEKEA